MTTAPDPGPGEVGRVSVVIPTYNRAAYLAQAIDSMRGQLESDDELIVVDDGSTDDTADVLARYDGRIRVVRTPNGGLGAARNVGIATATGDWIAFHDSDDVARPGRLALQRAWVRRRPDVDAVLCNGEYLGRAGTFVVPPDLAQAHRERLVGVRALFEGFPLYFQGALVRREAFTRAGIFDTGLRVHTDLDYGYRLLHVARALFVDDVVFDYRWHGANITADRLAGREELARILRRLLEEAPAVAREVGRRRIVARLARHYFRLARVLEASGRVDEARTAIAEARRLRPFHLRYRLLRVDAPPSTSVRGG